MTYNVFGGTLNPSLSCSRCTWLVPFSLPVDNYSSYDDCLEQSVVVVNDVVEQTPQLCLHGDRSL